MPSALASVVLPGKVKVIGESAFAQCDSLTAIELPKSVARIDGGAFRDCAGLQSVRYLGKMEDRAKIAVCAGNAPLLDAAWTLLHDPGVPHDGYCAFVYEKCAPSFGYYGRFADAEELKKEAEELYERA